MKILLTNDDGIMSPGIFELAKGLAYAKHEVFVVAPRAEQSGISSAITFLRPLFPVKLTPPDSDQFAMTGYSIDGTPADCARLALTELCASKPDLVISGINGGLNAGVNVCYSGTVGGALVASSFGTPAIAVSLEYAQKLDFARATEIAIPIIEKFDVANWPERVVVNLNIPTAALTNNAAVLKVPVETNPLGYGFESGTDPKGRSYYWATNKPDPIASPYPTDCSVLKSGNISMSTITYDPNSDDQMSFWKG